MHPGMSTRGQRSAEAADLASSRLDSGKLSLYHSVDPAELLDRYIRGRNRPSRGGACAVGQIPAQMTQKRLLVLGRQRVNGFFDLCQGGHPWKM
jgi:hypothetical protein